MTRTFAVFAAIFGFLGVALGAFGAHALNATLTANGRTATFETAVQYQMIHALALFAAAWASEKWPGRPTRWAGILFAAGIVIFSGSLYILAIFDLRFMGAITPIGGVAFLAAWACLGWAAFAWRSGAGA
jgi:uncharacterized membrane protein YgdD (TMEM256/DUF423 family)